ncbi:hypothetical protein AF72_09300 [Xylella taiwanensis]|uniref:Uncharacterized protein n=1 Tax=Xylella taiwanensis TaxID=1444770 RepID=Z9JHS6_9GAMM|nr:hypothetical protein AB672_10175 [Xylella taiwanensis]EWS77739.1 hypothetical protein AF72_09300 [Xylella taiwanensis]
MHVWEFLTNRLWGADNVASPHFQCIDLMQWAGDLQVDTFVLAVITLLECARCQCRWILPLHLKSQCTFGAIIGGKKILPADT